MADFHSDPKPTSSPLSLQFQVERADLAQRDELVAGIARRMQVTDRRSKRRTRIELRTLARPVCFGDRICTCAVTERFITSHPREHIAETHWFADIEAARAAYPEARLLADAPSVRPPLRDASLELLTEGRAGFGFGPPTCESRWGCLRERAGSGNSDPAHLLRRFMTKLTGPDLHRLRTMIPGLKAAAVAPLACMQLSRLLEIERSEGVPPTLAELGAIFHVLQRARNRQVLPDDDGVYVWWTEARNAAT